jgi:hypothetical protein
MLNFDRDTNPSTFKGTNGILTDVTSLWNSLIIVPAVPGYRDNSLSTINGLDHIVSFGEDNQGNLTLWTSVTAPALTVNTPPTQARYSNSWPIRLSVGPTPVPPSNSPGRRVVPQAQTNILSVGITKLVRLPGGGRPT